MLFIHGRGGLGVKQKTELYNQGELISRILFLEINCSSGNYDIISTAVENM